MATIGVDETQGAATRMVIVTGAGPSLIRRDALPPGALDRVQEVRKGGATELRDANGMRLRTSGSVTLRVKSRPSRALLIPGRRRPLGIRHSGVWLHRPESSPPPTIIGPDGPVD